MVRKLLKKGVKSNTKNHRGETALHVVSRARDDSQDSARVVDAEEAGVAVAQLLLGLGADVNAKTWSGETPLDLVSNRRPKLAQLLRERSEKEKPSY